MKSTISARYAVVVFGQYRSRKCRFTNLPVGVRGSSASEG
jgi:hypothetical protein